MDFVHSANFEIGSACVAAEIHLVGQKHFGWCQHHICQPNSQWNDFGQEDSLPLDDLGIHSQIQKSEFASMANDYGLIMLHLLYYDIPTWNYLSWSQDYENLSNIYNTASTNKLQRLLTLQTWWKMTSLDAFWYDNNTYYYS